MGRFKFILLLIFVAVSLHFFAKTLRTLLTLVETPARQYAAAYADPRATARPPRREPPGPSVTDQLSRQIRRLVHQLSDIRPKRTPSPRRQERPPFPPPEHLPAPQATPAHEPSFLQITLEDLRPPIRNPHLGAEASARLDGLLSARRARNANLADETEALFGAAAKREVIRILIDDERACTANAKESKSAAEFARRQRKTDETTEQKLSAVFERYKAHYNRRATDNSPGWNLFFKRVNDFKKAND